MEVFVELCVSVGFTLSYMGRHWRLLNRRGMWSNLCFNMILLATMLRDGLKEARAEGITTWSFQMPQGIVTQAIVERWLLRNGWLWMVQPSCLFGNLWFAANTAWKQMGIPVTWSSVLSTRLPFMLNKKELVVRMSHWNATAGVIFLMFQAQNSVLIASYHSVLWPAWGVCSWSLIKDEVTEAEKC